MRILHRPNMVVMRVENSFPCEGCLIGKTTLHQEKGIRSTFSKVPLCESNTRRCNGKPRLSLLHFVYSFLDSSLHAEAHSVRRLESVLFLPLTMSALSNEPVSANLGAVLQRNYDWEYASSDIVPRTNAVRLAHYNLQPRTPNAYRLTLRSCPSY
ncbi:hypothetical protein TNCV_4966731 [Trichonephila clavipes]|nr:hypothetical protein TNCV_4966731 [Trichonephila clavipes]